MLDIKECEDLIPDKYKQPGNYENDPNTLVIQRSFNGKVPLDYAFARWLCMEKGLAMMPGTCFATEEPDMVDHFTRIAICKTPDIVSGVRKNLGL